MARVGGVLIIAGSVAVGIWAIVFGAAPASAGSDSLGGARSDTLLVGAFALLLGAGAVAVRIAAHPPFGSRLTRVGLGLVGVGMLGIALGRTVVVPTGGNELTSFPYLILVFGGGLATAIGTLVCGVSLARSPSAGPRIAGLALLAGPASLPLAAAISLALQVDTSVIVLIGLGLLVLGWAGIGILALGLGGTRGSKTQPQRP